jgi:hypothetical protein
VTFEFGWGDLETSDLDYFLTDVILIQEKKFLGENLHSTNLDTINDEYIPVGSEDNFISCSYPPSESSMR